MQLEFFFFCRATEREVTDLDVSKEKSEKPQFPLQSSLDGKNGLQGGFQAKSSGSFDGPFRKPRLPAPPKKKTEKSKLSASVL